MSVLVWWLILIAMAVAILITSNFLAKAADVIAEKTGLGRSFIGVVLLATATSLPELGTGLSSILLVGEPDLAAGDAFGSNLFNILIIGVLDLVWRNGPILNAVTKTPVLVAGLGILLISISTLALVIHGSNMLISDWYVSPMSLLLIVIFLVSMYLIFRRDKQTGEDISLSPDLPKYESYSLSRSSLVYFVSAAALVVASVILAKTGHSIAQMMGWEASFVGTQFLALSTSLPELATSLAALKLGAPELAISNVLGSNIFNMGFVLFLDDLAYVDGPLWGGVSQIHILTGIIAILMTAVVMTSLIAGKSVGYRDIVLSYRGYKTKIWTLESLVLLILYAVASILMFKMA